MTGQPGTNLTDLPVISDGMDETNLVNVALSFNSQLTRRGAPEEQPARG